MGHKGPDGDSYTRADDLTDDGLVTVAGNAAEFPRVGLVWQPLT